MALIVAASACARQPEPRPAGGLLARASASSAPTGLVPKYGRAPTWRSASRGLFDTGVALADIDADGWTDIVVSSGNDMEAQSLDVYFNHAPVREPARAFGTTAGRPEFSTSSTARAYFGHAAVGDVDRDGCPDVAVAVPYGWKSEEEAEFGGVEVFFNRRSGSRCAGLRKTPGFSTGNGLLAISCALADVDGDGDLDLVVPVLAEANGRVRWPPKSVADDGARSTAMVRTASARATPMGAVEMAMKANAGRARIFLNQNGTLDTSAAWRSDPATRAADVAVADVDQDGLLDLVFASMRTSVYFGTLDASGRPTIETAPRWQGEPSGIFSYSVEVGPSSPAGLGVVASFTPLSWNTTQPDYPFLMYRPRRDGSMAQPVWQSDDRGRGSRVLAADLDGDGLVDLAAGRWSSSATTADGAPLQIYGGNAAASFSRVPVWTSERDDIVSQGIGAANLYTRPRSDRWSMTVPEKLAGRFVLTIPKPNVRRVVGIRRGGRPLADAEFAFAPGETWVSFVDPLATGDAIEVDLLVDDRPDLVVADWGPDGPTLVFAHQP